MEWRQDGRHAHLLYSLLGVAAVALLAVLAVQGKASTSSTAVHAAAVAEALAAAGAAGGGAAARGRAQQALAALVEHYQEEQRQFCSELAAGVEQPMGTPANDTYFHSQVTAQHDGATATFDMWALAGNDIVSSSIQQTASWEEVETNHVLDRLAEWRDMHILDSNQTVLLDIGANVGWFSLNAAALGYRVLAAEPMAKNIGAIRRSLCSNPELQSRLTLVTKGLSNKPDRCSFYVKKFNRGNGVTACKDSGTAGVHADRSFEKVGEYELSTLDEIVGEAALALRGRLPVVKVDVEGFEPNAYAGGWSFFDTVKPKYIMAEVNEEYAGQGFRTLPPLALLKLYDEMCYDIHLNSFHGELLDRRDFESIAAQRMQPGSLFNIYLVRRQGCSAMDLR